jgi:hypothetical protein
MTPGEFLRAVWPSEGIYCLATPFVIPNSNPPKKVYSHKTFDNISDAVSYVLSKRMSQDLFFAVHTLKEHQVWDPHKVNLKTGETGSNSVRTQPNMKAARAFFFDLDVGSEANKYSSQEEAGQGLIKFCQQAKLPKPLVVSSGGGLHVYWIVVEPLDSADWRVHATKLRQLAVHYGLKIDPSRTTDIASVLRVAGTFNYKIKSQPREVAAITAAAEIGTGEFVKRLDTAMIEAGVRPMAPVKQKLDEVERLLGNNTTREFSGPPVSMKAVVLACKQMQRLVLAKGKVSEPEWYHGIIGVGRFTQDGHRRIMQMSDPAWHPMIQEKIHQHEQRRDPVSGQKLGPTSCAKLAEVSGAGDEPCVGCPFAGKVHGPIGAGRFKDPAPPPQVIELASTATSAPILLTIPDPPAPFVRLKGGGIAVHGEDGEGNVRYTTIYEHDLFPVRRLVNSEHGLEQQVWHVELPLNTAKDFTLDADMLYDPRKFTTAIANQGIYPHKGNIPGLQEYMVAYIAQLQKLVNADAQCNHLGWSDDFASFILPDKVLSVDGSVRSAQLSVGAQRTSTQIHKKGDAKRQAELLRFYDHEDYLAHQFFILCSLAAPIFHATGHHGVIVNASGKSGASKSTSLYAAASIWGHPKLYPINGTNNGATIRGRNERVTVLANLPVCVDEITHMLPRDAIDLAMSVTQPGHRIRLDNSGQERAHLGSYKSTIMMTTANNSLHGVLSQDNSQGTAGSMRVFEMEFAIPRVHKKSDADAFLFELTQNYGHLGEIFISHVIANLDAVVGRIRDVMAEVDAALQVQPSERYWSGTIATALVAGEIATQLGIVSYDLAAIKRWLYEVQVPAMRGVVRDEYVDPLSLLTDYLQMISANMVVMDTSSAAVGSPVFMAQEPRGALYAHYDKHEEMLYVLKKGFKDHCARTGASAAKILDELHLIRDGERIIPAVNSRRTLGAGTHYAKGQARCFSINMAHKEISGAVDLTVVDGGGQGVDRGSPGLQLVQ